MKEAQVSLKLKQIAERGELKSLSTMPIYNKVVYYAIKHKLTVAEYVQMKTGETYVPVRKRTSPLEKIYPPLQLWDLLEYFTVSELADKSGYTKQAIYKLIDRYRERGVWGEKQETT